MTVERAPVSCLRVAVFTAAIAALGLFAPEPISAEEMAAAEMVVDAAIVLAVDSSFSVDPAAADLQRLGHADALLSSQVADAISKGLVGCIAITYVEWSSVGEIRTVLPWTRLCDGDDTNAAAAAIAHGGDAGYRRPWRGRSSLSFAIAAGSLMLDRFPGEAARRIIDISTNGTNNDGVPVIESRDRTLRRGHIINAIAISREEPGVTADLPAYLAASVIGGPGAFAIAAERAEDYAAALRMKLVLEISAPAGPLLPDGRDGGAVIVHGRSEAPQIRPEIRFSRG